MNKSAALLVALAFLIASCINSVKMVNADSKKIVVPDDYATISEAINHANNGDTVYIKEGAYIENLNITKRISLVGQNSNSTILKGGIVVRTSDVKIDSLKLVGSGRWAQLRTYNYGVATLSGKPTSLGSLQETWGTTISNCIFENWVIAMSLMSGDGERIINNTIMNADEGIEVDTFNNFIAFNKINCSGWGISLGSEYITGNLLYGNSISGGLGIEINWFNHDNSVIGNTILGANYGIHLGVYPEGYGPCSNNTVFHNNFINNFQQVFLGSQSVDFWDNGYPSGGNYWSNYTGADTNHDGIGDTPQIINPNNQDRYPLMSQYATSEGFQLVNFTDTFRDGNGLPLAIKPASFKLTFSNGTTSLPLSLGTYLIQSGASVLHSVVWQGTDVTPEIPVILNAGFGTPTVKCKIYRLTVNPIFYNMRLNQTDNSTSYTILKPSSWSMSFPNGTIGTFYSDVTLSQTQTGYYEMHNAVLQNVNITFPPITLWLTSNSDWSPSIVLFEPAGNQTFGFDSNSTIAQPDFNATSQMLSFTASGPNGTFGYTKITFAVSLTIKPEGIVVRQDGNQINYTLAHMDDAWLLAINYTHSTHKFDVDFGANEDAIPEFSPPTALTTLIIALILLTVLAAVFLKIQKKGFAGDVTQFVVK